MNIASEKRPEDTTPVEHERGGPFQNLPDSGKVPNATVIQEIEESLHIEKRVVEKDGYRLTKVVKTHQQLVDEELRDHRIEIEHRAIGQQLPSGVAMPEPHYEGDTLVIPVIEEILVTQKRLLLIEEVRITRIQSSHRSQATVELRKEIIEIEQLADGSPTDKPA